MTKRILWLFGHTSLRKWEVPLLVELGYEVFCPKIFGVEFGDCSASVTWEYDATLTIPQDVLNKLNGVNFYQEIDSDCMVLLNQYFDITFCMVSEEPLRSILYRFRGTIVAHAFGLPDGYTYGSVIEVMLGPQGLNQISRLGNRFWFSQTYDNLAEIEPEILKRRAIYMPIGLGSGMKDTWVGGDERFLFVGPKIRTNYYYRNIYEKFCRDFGDLPHVIGGGQMIPVTEDSTVTNFLPWDDYVYNMTRLSCMYYHSQNKRHLHYHPLEAIQYGMPLIFMSGGMLDHLGGEKLPGRCTSVEEARKKIKRLARGDKKLAYEIRESQTCLLKPFTTEYCRPYWETAMRRIEESSGREKQASNKKVAVILPAAYTGGVFDYSARFCECLLRESKKNNDNLELVFAYPRDKVFENYDPILKMRKKGIRTESYEAELVDDSWIHQVKVLKGMEGSNEHRAVYTCECVLRDGKRDFMDFDFAFIMSDASPKPAPIFLPIPHAVIAHDYIQQYVPNLIPHEAKVVKLENQRRADYVFVTSEPTGKDAQVYAGITSEKIRLTPYMLQYYSGECKQRKVTKNSDYFVWSTNAAMHKNHLRALKALEEYYQNGGTLECIITGVNTEYFRKKAILSGAPVAEHYVEQVKDYLWNSNILKKRVSIRGNIPKREYIELLGNAAFVFHPGYGDNGNGSVFDAASLGIPAIVSEYPAMRYMGEFMKVPLWSFDPFSPKDMAEKLLVASEHQEEYKAQMPSESVLMQADYRVKAGELYQTVRDVIGL